MPQAIALSDIPVDQRPTGLGARRYLAETWEGGAYDIERLSDGTYIARFREDDSTIPLRDMGYNREYGLFQRSVFPDLPDEDTYYD